MAQQPRSLGDNVAELTRGREQPRLHDSMAQRVSVSLALHSGSMGSESGLPAEAETRPERETPGEAYGLRVL